MNKVFGDFPYEPRKDRYRYDKDGNQKYSGKRQAEEASCQWCDELEAQALEGYEAAVEREEKGLEPSTIDGYRYNRRGEVR